MDKPQRRSRAANRRRLEILERRVLHLGDRVDDPGRREASKQFDRAELDALIWAVDVVKDWMSEDPLCAESTQKAQDHSFG